MERSVKLTSILYYLAYLVAAGISIPILISNGAVGGSVSLGLIFIGLYGLLSFLSLELVDEFGGWYIALGIIRRVLSVIFIGMSVILYVSVYEDVLHGGNPLTLPRALILGAAILPIVYILIRSAVYCFTFDRADERVSLGIGIALPFVCYALSVGMIYISALLSLGVLFVLWLLFQVFVRGELGPFGRFLFNLIFYGACFGVSIYFAVNNQPFMCMAFMAMAFCFFYFLGTDLCRESNFGYWFFNVIGMVGILVFFIAGMVSVMDSGLEGMEYGFKSSFPYVWKNAIFFAPFVYAVLRAPFYKLAAENEWDNGLGDFFMTLLLPLAAYLIAIPMLLVGFLYAIMAIVVLILIAMLIMYFRGEYIPFGDIATNVRDNADDYIVFIVIIGQ